MSDRKPPASPTAHAGATYRARRRRGRCQSKLSRRRQHGSQPANTEIILLSLFTCSNSAALSGFALCVWQRPVSEVNRQVQTEGRVAIVTHLQCHIYPQVINEKTGHCWWLLCSLQVIAWMQKACINTRLWPTFTIIYKRLDLPSDSINSKY